MPDHPTPRPSDRAIGQAFNELRDSAAWWNGLRRVSVEAVERRAREIDAATPTDPPEVGSKLVGEGVVRWDGGDAFDQFLAAEVDTAPEALRRLGEWLSRVLDEDDFKTADGLVLGAMLETSEAIRAVARNATHPSQDAEDAERYRWLRDVCDAPAYFISSHFQHDFDAAIDDARAAGGPEIPKEPEVAQDADQLRTARDAERYRKLRAATKADWCVTTPGKHGGVYQYIGAALDHALDTTAPLPATMLPQLAGYMAFGREDDGDLVPLEQYTGRMRTNVAQKVLDVARKEGYTGTAEDRLRELNWVVRPVYVQP